MKLLVDDEVTKKKTVRGNQFQGFLSKCDSLYTHSSQQAKQQSNVKSTYHADEDVIAPPGLNAVVRNRRIDGGTDHPAVVVNDTFTEAADGIHGVFQIIRQNISKVRG